MENLTENVFSFPKHLISKIEALECTLNQTLYNFKDLVSEFKQMNIQSEMLKKEIVLQKDKCESKSCTASMDLKKVIESKDNIIQLVASALSRMNESKNFELITDVFKILFGESTSLPNNVEQHEQEEDINSDDIDLRSMSLATKEVPDMLPTTEQDESVSEVPGTPTGRTSPIIQSKMLRGSTPNKSSRDKKKCPGTWVTPETKAVKVSGGGARGRGRSRQQRLSLVRERAPARPLDLTASPAFARGRCGDYALPSNIKQEVVENDDTIMPSPTSGTVFPSVYKTVSKESPQKFKKPLSVSRVKGGSGSREGAGASPPSPPDQNSTFAPELGDSVRLLDKFQKGFISPDKCNSENTCSVQADESMSLLRQGNMGDIVDKPITSPVKRPLAENLNLGNVAVAGDIESSISILRRDAGVKQEAIDDNIKRSKSDILEPLYKEPTVRRKAEKRALPGWSCDECKDFYGKLYADNPAMLARKMDECSKHRGRSNPQRPRTPPGFWQPRWDVPADTDEFNRRNNAV